MNPRLLLVECNYRNRNQVWIAPNYIESIAATKGGSVVKMISGFTHELLDTPDEITNRIVDAISATSPSPAMARR